MIYWEDASDPYNQQVKYIQIPCKLDTHSHTHTRTHARMRTHTLLSNSNSNMNLSSDQCNWIIIQIKVIWITSPHVKCILCVISDEEGNERFLYQGHCRLHCPREFYPDREQYTCLPCMPNCEICADANVCAKCREGYNLQSGICLTVLCGVGESVFL